ncbi:MAG: DNA-3-methyladenine glycosylase [Planctomycetota bacterium]
MRWGRSRFEGDTVALAQDLIGRVLVRTQRGVRTAGVIVETEAYLGVEDRAAHSVGARWTARTAPMFGKPGTAYVFLVYGVHHCFNIASEAEGNPCAILIRALEPVDGIGTMHARRGAKRSGRLRERNLCSGPGKLCEALAIDRSLTGVDLCDHPGVWIEEGEGHAGRGWSLGNGPRIGVDYAGEEWASKPLRWWVEGNAHVSR